MNWSVAAAAMLVAAGSVACGTGSTPSAANVLSPTGPTQPQPVASMSLVGIPHSNAGVALVGGQFTLSTTSAADFVTGSYTGSVSVGSPTSASLQINVTGGGGQFEGASGSLQGAGSGAFAGEGTFELSLKGSISRPGRSNDAPFRANLQGTSLVACAGGQIQVTMQGGDPGTKLGPVSAVLQHIVAGACSP